MILLYEHGKGVEMSKSIIAKIREVGKFSKEFNKLIPLTHTWWKDPPTDCLFIFNSDGRPIYKINNLYYGIDDGGIYMFATEEDALLFENWVVIPKTVLHNEHTDINMGDLYRLSIDGLTTYRNNKNKPVGGIQYECD